MAGSWLGRSPVLGRRGPGSMKKVEVAEKPKGRDAWKVGLRRLRSFVAKVMF